MIVIMLDMYRYVMLIGDFHFWNAEPQLAATLLRSEKPAWALRNYREVGRNPNAPWSGRNSMGLISSPAASLCHRASHVLLENYMWLHFAETASSLTMNCIQTTRKLHANYKSKTLFNETIRKSTIISLSAKSHKKSMWQSWRIGKGLASLAIQL